MALYIVLMKAARLLEASTRSSNISGYGRFLKFTFFLDFSRDLTIFLWFSSDCEVSLSKKNYVTKKLIV